LLDNCVTILLKYIFQNTELLRIRVAKGDRLGKRDLFGVVSPYCVIRLEKASGEQIDEVTLEKKKKTRDPVWNSILTFRVTRQCCLKFFIFDENKITRDPVWNSILTFRVTRQCCLKFFIFDENKI
ncbi:C2 domain protein, partial [Oesophagostomum dentatum]